MTERKQVTISELQKKKKKKLGVEGNTYNFVAFLKHGLKVWQVSKVQSVDFNSLFFHIYFYLCIL